jgi:ribosomal protein S21
LNRSKGRQGNKTFTKNYNSDRKQKFQKKEEHYLDAFNPSIEVRNGDVNKAIRVLKKRLEKSDFQKELAKQQYYETKTALTSILKLCFTIETRSL